jgi:predicted dehydrogenase
MIDIGVHVLDVALYLLGNPVVEEVSAVTRQHFGNRADYTSPDFYGEDNGPDGFNVDDSVTAFIRCDGGKTIVLEAAWAANRDNDSTITVVGTEAGASYDIKGTDVEFFEVDRRPDAENPLPTPTHIGDHRNGHVEELDYFLSVIKSGTNLTQNTVQEACDVQRVIEAIYESSESNRAIPVNTTEVLPPTA